MSATNILNIANNTADNVVIGRVVGTTALGFYAVAFRLADFPNTVIAHIVGRVMFPVYSLLQNEIVRFRRAFIQNLQRIAVLALPVSVTILVCAEPLVLGLFGPKWEEAIGPLRILAAYGLVKLFTAPGGEVFGARTAGARCRDEALQIGLVVPRLIVLVRSNGLRAARCATLIAISVCGVLKSGRPAASRSRATELGRALAPSLLCGRSVRRALPAHAGDGPLSPRVSLLVSSLRARRSTWPQRLRSPGASSGRCGTASEERTRPVTCLAAIGRL